PCVVGGGLAAAPAGACDGLLVYAGAGFRLPLEEAAAEFSAREGVPVETTFAGSGCLLAQAELAGHGDVFIPGERHYLVQAEERDLAGDAVCLAWLRPVLAVPAGNPLGVTGPADLARPGLRVGLGDPRSVAVGLASESWLAATLTEEERAAVQSNVVTRALNVNELGTQLSLGALDVAVVWDVTVPLFSGLEAVVNESSLAHRTMITGAALRQSEWPDEARRFLAFLSGPDGQSIFREYGYEPTIGCGESVAP
ncbi:MAG: substrate-binding domain-containing protein, partial [Gemmatimonadetes bacterium]|nr:substrate-binding domain-containing protein [Gemmatimonadota bacterium]